jgi:hypothetical protein
MKTLITVLLVLTFSGGCFAQNSPKSNSEEVSVISLVLCNLSLCNNIFVMAI